MPLPRQKKLTSTVTAAISLIWLAALALAAEQAPITRVSEIRNLTRDDAASELPVRFSGVCIWEGFGDFVVHDGEQSIWVSKQTALSRGKMPRDFDFSGCLPGALMEVVGTTDPGGYAPIVVPTKLKVLGSGPLPEPRRVAVEELLAGNDDGQMVEVEGVVQDCSRTQVAHLPVLALMTEGHYCRVLVARPGAFDYAKLVDARVRVRGIYAPDANFRSEVQNLKILPRNEKDMTVIIPPPSSPFDSPRVPLNRLMPFSPRARPYNRTVTEGLVIYSVPGQFFFLQDGQTSVRVASADKVVRAGHYVEVAGFLEKSQPFASLKNAVVREMRAVPLPQPVPVTVEKLLDPSAGSQFGKAAADDLSGRRVRLNGILRRIDWKSPAVPESIWIEAGGRIFSAHLPIGHVLTAEQLKAWAIDSAVELTGVCELEFRDRMELITEYRPIGFHLWMALPEDLKVLSPPVWWSASKLWVALGIAAILLGLVLAWNQALRLMLLRRSRRLEELMKIHRDSELEFQGARHERQRLAGDLHDGLQQMLVGASYRMEAAAAHLGEVPPAVQKQFDAARGALLRTQEGLREFLWGLHHVEQDADDFAALLRHAADSLEHWPPNAVEVHVEGHPFPLSRHVMGTLLLLMQESAGNAFKHGAAAKVRIQLGYQDDCFEMLIQDDGSGFEIAHASGAKQGHFGLESISNRMQWLGGRAEITSAPGVGTRVRCVLPKSHAQLPSNKPKP